MATPTEDVFMPSLSRWDLFQYFASNLLLGFCWFLRRYIVPLHTATITPTPEFLTNAHTLRLLDEGTMHPNLLSTLHMLNLIELTRHLLEPLMSPPRPHADTDLLLLLPAALHRELIFWTAYLVLLLEMVFDDAAWHAWRQQALPPCANRLRAAWLQGLARHKSWVERLAAADLVTAPPGSLRAASDEWVLAQMDPEAAAVSPPTSAARAPAPGSWRAWVEANVVPAHVAVVLRAFSAGAVPVGVGAGGLAVRYTAAGEAVVTVAAAAAAADGALQAPGNGGGVVEGTDAQQQEATIVVPVPVKVTRAMRRHPRNFERL